MPSVQIAVNVLLDFFCLAVAVQQMEYARHVQTNMKSRYVEHSNLMRPFRIMLELEILGWIIVRGCALSRIIVQQTLAKVAPCLLVP